MKEIARHKVEQAQAEFSKMDGTTGLVTVTEWYNDEGFDINVDGDNRFNISITYDEYDTIDFLIKHLQRMDSTEDI